MFKNILKDSPARVVGKGKRASFVLVDSGKTTGLKLRGITKRLKRIYSTGVLPMIARRADPRPGNCWRGKNGGRRRGRAVDKQLSMIVNDHSALDKIEHTLTLTKSALVTLAMSKLEPIVAQRPVASEKHKLATAIDIVAARGNTLALVEVKTGHDHGRTAVALKNGQECHMRGPVSDAMDHTLNRHCAQLAVTRALFMREKTTIKKLKKNGIKHIVGLLLYVNDAGSSLFKLPAWWEKKGVSLLDALR